MVSASLVWGHALRLRVPSHSYVVPRTFSTICGCCGRIPNLSDYGYSSFATTDNALHSPFAILPLLFFQFFLFLPQRTPDGEMFVVKDPDLFASKVIPQYFDHNKFSSFARQ
jgi:hypothetical protein